MSNDSKTTAREHCTRPDWCTQAKQCHEWLSHLEGCAYRVTKAKEPEIAENV